MRNEKLQDGLTVMTCVIVFFFDLQKAFNSVSHRLLLAEVHLLAPLLHWLTDYLLKQSQRLCTQARSAS